MLKSGFAVLISAGLVISNSGANFSAGANVGMIFMFAIEQEYDELDMAIRMFQNSMMRVRYSSIPVVIAPHGLTLGGGCEMNLHADKICAAAIHDDVKTASIKANSVRIARKVEHFVIIETENDLSGVILELKQRLCRGVNGMANDEHRQGVLTAWDGQTMKLVIGGVPSVFRLSPDAAIFFRMGEERTAMKQGDWIGGEQDSRSYREDHPLDDHRQPDLAMIETVLDAVGHRTIVEQRRPALADAVQHRLDSDDVEIAVLLAREGGRRKVLSCCAGTHRVGGFVPKPAKMPCYLLSHVPRDRHGLDGGSDPCADLSEAAPVICSNAG
jgi:hypothetical protein